MSTQGTAPGTASVAASLSTLTNAVTALGVVGILSPYCTADTYCCTIVVSRLDYSRAISTLNSDSTTVPTVTVSETHLTATVPTTSGPVRLLSSLT